ncbi:MAG: tetratricopeptide repeat protein [Candidatus Hatepunaea meridiana]|nr:tetratricopeptide repeat protein [Candidatus Hatepunaea meridiana]
MTQKLIQITITILLISSALCWAEQKVFTQTVRYVMGENESRQELRELATLEAKRQILEQVGVYIESTTELKQRITESKTEFQDETEYKKEILAITAGVTNTEIDAEVWKEEAGVFVLYLTCRISVDTEDVNRKIQELVQDRRKLDDRKMLQDEVTRLQSDMVELRQRLELAEASQVKEIKQQRNSLSDKFSATEWFEKGLATDDIDKAIEYYSYAIEQKPDWSRTYYNRGTVYVKKGDYDHAISDFNRAIQIDPNLAMAYYNRGTVYVKKGDYDLAITDYNRAILIDPNDVATYCNRGSAYVDKGDYDQAIVDYNRAIQIDPNGAIVYYNRGNAYKNKGDYDQAIVDYNSAIQIDPNYADAYNNRGIAYCSKGDYDNAIADYNREIQINPNDAQAYSSRGLAYCSKGNYDLAMTDFSKAIQIDPNDASAYYCRGLAYWYGLKDKINARRSFQKAKELGLPEAQKELDKLR